MASRLRRSLERLVVSDELRARAQQLPTRDLGELGVDPFGYDPEYVPYVGTPAAWLYRHYFRVEAFGVENVPAEGRVLLVANHSGQLPFDAFMIAAAQFLERDPPRMVRSMVERWIPRLPWVSTLFARVGQIVGTPDNCRRLLARDEAILVFPEGVRGISKTFDQRYQLQRFGHGFVRLALETQTPVVPVAVVGAEEQAPALANLEPVAKLLSMPAFPITPTFPALGPLGLVPLPTRYRIHFGAPLHFSGTGEEEEAAVRTHVERVRLAIEQLLAHGLAQREGVFR
ncbi:MAG: lysophospholipid acyltransferase family protein [Myxococcota bacterium]